MDFTALDMPEFDPGWVWLAGAGPGDPGLVTLQTAYALSAADVVVYDALVNPVILELAGPDCAIEFAGKRGGKPSPKQRDISLRLIELARAGRRVLRLKGGDPFVFGRGGEEALALVDAGIPFRILPGISAGIGGAAYAGIPVTHRDFNHAVTFLTGHDTTGLVPDAINWQAIADGSPVIVMYMALKHMASISERLMAAGRPGDEPVAVISRATLHDQRVVETTLAHVVEDASRAGIEPPVLVIVGQIVRLRAALDWLGAFAAAKTTAAAERQPMPAKD